MNGVESLGRVRLQGILLLLVTFLAGGLVGVAADRIFLLPDRPAGGPMRAGLPPRVLERLEITPGQREQISRILQEARPKTDSVLREALPRLRAITGATRAEILLVLTPEQRARLREEIPALGRGRRGPGLRGLAPERPLRDDGWVPPVRGGNEPPDDRLEPPG